MYLPRELCDIGDIGKLTREQFALALHLINQKLSKGLDPPQSLSPEMIPPSDRLNIKQVRHFASLFPRILVGLDWISVLLPICCIWLDGKSLSCGLEQTVL